MGNLLRRLSGGVTRVVVCVCQAAGSVLARNDFGVVYCSNGSATEPVSPTWQVFSSFHGSLGQPRWFELTSQNNARSPTGFLRR